MFYSLINFLDIAWAASWKPLYFHALIINKITLMQKCINHYRRQPTQTFSHWDGSFEHSKHMFKLMGKSIITAFMPQKELWEAYSIRTVVRPSVPLRVRCISPVFFEIGIPNLVCGCILGRRSVTYHFRVTVTLTLTSDLVFTVITMSVRLSRFVSDAYHLYSLR